MNKFLHGLLAFHVASEHWRSTRLYPLKDRDGSFALNGLIYNETVRVRVTSRDRDEIFRIRIEPRDVSGQRRQKVFNLHTRVWYRLPRPLQLTTNFPVVGMLVDTSVRPYDFKVIQGSGDLGTQIYDSKMNSWEIRSSRLPAGIAAIIDYQRQIIPDGRIQSSVNFNGLLYIKSEEAEILVYNVNEDTWSALREPPTDGQEVSCNCIGAWQSRLFGFQECFDPEPGSISIWELVNPSSQEWQMYSRMPAQLYEWLTYKEGDDFVDVQPYASFSNNYVLIYSWICQEVRVERVVLFDLATKSWKPHLPFGEFGAHDGAHLGYIFEDCE